MKSKHELMKELYRQTRMVKTRDHKIEQLQRDLKVAHKDLKVSDKNAASQQSDLEAALSKLSESQEINDLLKTKLASYPCGALRDVGDPIHRLRFAPPTVMQITPYLAGLRFRLPCGNKNMSANTDAT
ncbi:MAG: hypothetical protein LBU34_10630 [Planctomycetaceae bacterium]|jgi:hypothetical protein|nr:hypothetical protein [Planctomycetaceae bacterium]